jgi:serine/threonine protein kinase
MDVCIQWNVDKLINPRTNRKIKPIGKVYKDLEIECANKSPSRRHSQFVHYSPECLKWWINPAINPTTNRKIKICGPTYQNLEKKCGKVVSPKAVLPKVVSPKVVSPKVVSPKAVSPKAVSPKAVSPKAVSPKAAHKIIIPDQEECDEWKINPTENPRTGRRISPNGEIYRFYQMNCLGVDTKKQSTTWFTQRLEKGIRVNNSLRTITSDQWNMCMSGINTSAFRTNFSNIVEIARGSFGQVYRAIIKTNNNENSDDIVIKEAHLEPDETRVLKNATLRNQKWESVKKNSYPRENRLLDLVNQLLLSRRCPNFIYVYNMAMCDGCNVQRLFNQNNPNNMSCYVLFMESANTDLDHLDLITYDEQLSVLYQILIAVYAIHRYYAIWHRDIKTSNIFIQRIKPGGYFEYVIEDKSYFVKNTGIVAYLSDFGVSETLSSLYSVTYYGTRNAEVMKSSREIMGSYLYWNPISISDQKPINWRDNTTYSYVKGTDNVITHHKNISSSIPINLNDNQKFPAFEFFDDIQDVIRMFVGGKQTKQSGSHKPLKKLSSEFLNLIAQKQAFFPVKNALYRTYGTVKYVLANEMLSQLYIEPEYTDFIVDRFVM